MYKTTASVGYEYPKPQTSGSLGDKEVVPTSHISQPASWLINLDKCIPQKFSKYLQIRVYEEGQSLHNVLWNTSPQQLALGIVSTNHVCAAFIT